LAQAQANEWDGCMLRRDFVEPVYGIDVVNSSSMGLKHITSRV
jgi:hypothetical protein